MAERQISCPSPILLPNPENLSEASQPEDHPKRETGSGGPHQPCKQPTQTLSNAVPSSTVPPPASAPPPTSVPPPTSAPLPQTRNRPATRQSALHRVAGQRLCIKDDSPVFLLVGSIRKWYEKRCTERLSPRPDEIVSTKDSVKTETNPVKDDLACLKKQDEISKDTKKDEKTKPVLPSTLDELLDLAFLDIGSDIAGKHKREVVASKEIHRDFVRCGLVGVIKGGDTVESMKLARPLLECTKIPPPNTMGPNGDKEEVGESDASKKRPTTLRPAWICPRVHNASAVRPCRGHHLREDRASADHACKINFRTTEDPAKIFSKVVSDPLNYPIYMTFSRTLMPPKKATSPAQHAASSSTAGTMKQQPSLSSCPSQQLPLSANRKRRISASNGKVDCIVLEDSGNKRKVPSSNMGGKTRDASKKAKPGQKSDEPICLLDSSDEEEGGHADVENIALVTDRKKNSETCQPSLNGFVNGTHKSKSSSHTKIANGSSATKKPGTETRVTLSGSIPIAKPDPRHRFGVDVFVMTPFGPGRVMSHRIDRHADVDSTLLFPVLMYLVDLKFGVVYVPSDQVRQLESTAHSESILLRYAGVALTEMDNLRLWPMTFLNDSLVNFYIKYLQRNLDERTTGDFFIFPTYFYTRISYLGSGKSVYKDNKIQRSKMFDELKGWTKGVDIFEKKFLIFPVNYDFHWTFVLVCHPNHPIIYGKPGEKKGKTSAATLKKSIMTDEAMEAEEEEPPLTTNSSESTTEDASKGKQAKELKTSHIDPGSSGINPKPAIAKGTKKKETNSKAASSCVVHLDSGKQFKIHNSATIFRHIRKYMTACYEATRSADCPGCTFTADTMPGLTPGVPLQTNTKDCGVYMLEIIERVLSRPPNVDAKFVEKKGAIAPFVPDEFGRIVTDLKRLRILGLIRELRNCAQQNSNDNGD